MSAGRAVGVAAAGAAGWIVGFYLGIFLVLSTVGLDDFEGWHFELATVSIGAVGAALAAALAGRRGLAALPRAVGAALVAAIAAIGGLRVIDGDFAVAIIGGGLVVVVAVAISVVYAGKASGPVSS